MRETDSINGRVVRGVIILGLGVLQALILGWLSWMTHSVLELREFRAVGSRYTLSRGERLEKEVVELKSRVDSLRDRILFLEARAQSAGDDRPRR